MVDVEALAEGADMECYWGPGTVAGIGVVLVTFGLKE